MFQEATGAAGGEDAEQETAWDRETEQEENGGEGRSAHEGSGIGDETSEEDSEESENDSEDEGGPYIEMVFDLLEEANSRIYTSGYWRRRRIMRMRKKGPEIRRRMS
jgi:hypothetical protein